MDEFFKSKKAKVIYALTCADSCERADLLDIDADLYFYSDLACKWYDNLEHIIISDSTKFDLEKQALENLIILYTNMVGGNNKVFSLIKEESNGNN